MHQAQLAHLLHQIIRERGAEKLLLALQLRDLSPDFLLRVRGVLGEGIEVYQCGSVWVIDPVVCEGELCPPELLLVVPGNFVFFGAAQLLNCSRACVPFVYKS
jgi:hypothetical protein